MIVRYEDEASFYHGITEFVNRGLTFEADHSQLTIKLTGGY